jgi:hypothetical protein
MLISSIPGWSTYVDGVVSTKVPQKRLSGPESRVLGHKVAESMPEQVRIGVGRDARKGHVLEASLHGLRRA